MRILFLILIVCFYSCNSIKPELSLIEDKTINWFHKDIESDSIPGISLDKAYDELVDTKSLDKIIIAVIDTSVDIHHEDLQDTFWINEDEIPSNNIDDDQNGYIDDNQGWNFIGNQEKDNVIYQQYESTRIVRDSIEYIDLDISSFDHLQYQRAKQVYTKEKARTLRILERSAKDLKKIKVERAFLNEHLKDTITLEKVDSLLAQTPELKEKISMFYPWIKRGLSYDALVQNRNGIKIRNDYQLNLNYDDRKIVGDSIENINDTNYGNSYINSHLDELYHGTMVTGVLISKRDNDKGINGFGDFINIMPLPICANGDCKDKDITLAFRYAVNNGAKVINLSYGKQYSANYNWVEEAIKYAESKDVLIIVAAGNDNMDLDNTKNYYFPNDINPNTDEQISNNFIRVGSSTMNVGEDLKSSFSNYGQNEIDIFAPGENINTPRPNNEYYINNKGTSLAAPLVSGVAALIRSHYPSLTASEVKQILMDSALKYDTLVDLPTKEDPDNKVPFSSLSKSGGIVNAYNALLMAEKVVKNQK